MSDLLAGLSFFLGFSFSARVGTLQHYIVFAALLKDQSLFMSSQTKQAVYGFTLVAKDTSPLGTQTEHGAGEKQQPSNTMERKQ